MRRKSKKAGANEAPATSAPDVTIVIDKVLYDLLKEGRIKHVLTWKDFQYKPAVIGVTSAQDDQEIPFKVKHMDTVGFGYLPEGYPSSFHANRKMTRFTVLPIEADDDAVGESTDGTETGPIIE